MIWCFTASEKGNVSEAICVSSNLFKKAVLCFKVHGPKQYKWTKQLNHFWVMLQIMVFGVLQFHMREELLVLLPVSCSQDKQQIPTAFWATNEPGIT